MRKQHITTQAPPAPIKIELFEPVELIFRELADRRVTQASVALTYRFIMRREPGADWPRINAAIRARWPGASALQRIKEMAWRRVE